MVAELVRTQIDAEPVVDQRPITLDSMKPGDQIDGQVWSPDIERDSGLQYRALVQIGLGEEVNDTNSRHVSRILGNMTLRAGDLVRAILPLRFPEGKVPTVNDVELVEVIATYEQIKQSRLASPQE
jgi:hypothetical protein